jgi:hypothetical protein
MHMSSQSNPVIAGTKLVVAHPNKTPETVKIELGGTLEFQNEYSDFYYFEIKFDEPEPPSAGDTLTGTMDEPISVHMPYEDKSFRYHISYKKKDGTCFLDPRILVARSCPGCRY